jgi:hypothetical protein
LDGGHHAVYLLDPQHSDAVNHGSDRARSCAASTHVTAVISGPPK